jgi:putative redox protein
MAAFKQVFDSMQSVLRGNADAAQAEFAATSRQQDGLKSTISVRQFQLGADEPPALGGRDSAPNPVEYVLAALGSCQEITYRLYADAMGIPLNGVSVKLKGKLDLRGFFAVDEAVRPGYQAIEAEVEIDSPASAADIARLKQAVDDHCPVLDMLTKPTPVNLTLRRRGEASQAA